MSTYAAAVATAAMYSPKSNRLGSPKYSCAVRIAPITSVVPRSGCLRMSTAGIATASSGSHNSCSRRNVPRESSAAIAIASTTLAGSDGWN